MYVCSTIDREKKDCNLLYAISIESNSFNPKTKKKPRPLLHDCTQVELRRNLRYILNSSIYLFIYCKKNEQNYYYRREKLDFILFVIIYSRRKN